MGYHSCMFLCSKHTQHMAGTPPMCLGIPWSRQHVAVLEISRRQGRSAPHGPWGSQWHPSMLYHGHHALYRRVAWDPTWREAVPIRCKPKMYMLAIGEHRSTEGVSDIHLLGLGCLIITCCQHPRSLKSHGTSTGPLALPLVAPHRECHCWDKLLLSNSPKALHSSYSQQQEREAVLIMVLGSDFAIR